MSVKIIACVGKNMELGKHGDLCFHIPEDMKFFRDTTMWHKVMMGRKTWESMGREPLKCRKNYVVSRHDMTDEVPVGVSAITDPEKYLKIFADVPPEDEELYRLFVIGGASLYQMALPYADEIYLTEVDAGDPEADTFFPDFDKTQYNKTIIKESSDHDLAFAFTVYKRKKE